MVRLWVNIELERIWKEEVGPRQARVRPCPALSEQLSICDRVVLYISRHTVRLVRRQCSNHRTSLAADGYGLKRRVSTFCVSTATLPP
jgi:hypothetical protein